MNHKKHIYSFICAIIRSVFNSELTPFLSEYLFLTYYSKELAETKQIKHPPSDKAFSKNFALKFPLSIRQGTTHIFATICSTNISTKIYFH